MPVEYASGFFLAALKLEIETHVIRERIEPAFERAKFCEWRSLKQGSLASSYGRRLKKLVFFSINNMFVSNSRTADKMVVVA